MGVTADDIIAAKIVCQLKLAPGDVVRDALETIERHPRTKGIDILADLLSRGAIDRAGRTRARKYARLYALVRRDAAYMGIVERMRLVPKERLDEALRRAEAARYEPRLGEILIELGEIAPAQDQRLIDEVRTVLEREDARITEGYVRARFEGVGRAITKDRNALLDTGQFTIKKLFRSKESQRLARLAEAVRAEGDVSTGVRSFVDRPADRPTDRMPPPVKVHDGTTDPDLDDGIRKVGGYILIRRLDAGGDSEVHLARHPSQTHPVALRFFPKITRETRRRVESEALAGRIDHENVVRVHDSGEADGVLYVALEHVPGETLRAMLARDGPLEPARALPVFRQVALALDALHGAGILHQNLVPESVLVTAMAGGELRAKLGDFRLAELGAPPRPASRARSSDDASTTGGATTPGLPHADLHGLGCLLFEMLTAELPFPPAAEDDATPRLLGQTRRAREFPPSLEELVARLLTPDARERAPSAGHVVRAIDEVVLPTLGRRVDPARVGAQFQKIFRERS